MTKHVCVRGGLSSGYLPQSSAAVSLKPDIRPWCVSGCQSCHGKERSAGRQMHCAAWTPVSLRSTTANKISDLPRYSSPATRNPLTRKCRDRIHDPPSSRARFPSSVQCVRTAQTRGAPPGAMVLAGPSASRRIPLAVRPRALVWELGQSIQPLLLAHRQCLRLRLGQSGRKAAHRPDASFCACERVTAERGAKNPLGVEQNI